MGNSLPPLEGAQGPEVGVFLRDWWIFEDCSLSKIRIMNSRKIIAASFIALSTLTLTSCTAAGKDAPTSKIKQVTDGVEGDIGGVKIRGLVLVSQGDGNAHLVEIGRAHV